MATNLNIKDISKYPGEEVLFLLFSCFEVTKIDKKFINNFGKYMKNQKNLFKIFR